MELSAGWARAPTQGAAEAPTIWSGRGAFQYLYAKFPLGFHEAPLSMRRRYAYTALGPAGAWWLRSRFDFGTALLRRSVLSAATDDGRVRLRLGRPLGEEDLVVDHVIAATGYRPGMSRLRFLEADLLVRIDETDGTPILDRSFQSSVPGLYFVGFPAGLSFGPVMRFVYGTAFAAQQVSRGMRAGWRDPSLACGPGSSSPPRLGAREAEWNTLAVRSGDPFLTHEWLSAWWGAFGRGKPVWVLSLDNGGSVEAGATLYRDGPRALRSGPTCTSGVERARPG